MGKIYIYNTLTDTWESGAKMPIDTQGITSSVVGTNIYVFGQNVKIYDTKNDTWSISTSVPNATSFRSSCTVGNKIYLMGGNSNAVDIYNTVDDSWETAPSLKLGGAQLGAVLIDNKIYTISNENDVQMLEIGESTVQNDVLSVLLNIGEIVQLSVSYDLADNTELTWVSSDESVATVDAKGKVTAIKEGLTYIKATNTDRTFDESIPVRVMATSADRYRLAVHLNVGQKQKLYLVDDPDTVTWSSLDPSIATVSANGEVTAVGQGLVIIQGKLKGETYQIYVRVNKPASA